MRADRGGSLNGSQEQESTRRGFLEPYQLGLPGTHDEAHPVRSLSRLYCQARLPLFPLAQMHAAGTWVVQVPGSVLASPRAGQLLCGTSWQLCCGVSGHGMGLRVQSEESGGA